MVIQFGHVLQAFLRPLAFILLILTALPGSAQVFIEASPVGTTPGGAIVVYGMNGTNPRIPYEKIKGSPFFNPQWRKASLLEPDGRSLGQHLTRLNLVTHQVHFMDKSGVELAANEGTVARMISFDTVNGVQRPVVFRNDLEEVNRNYGKSTRYAQEMNNGKISLLKVCIRSGIQGDSLFGTQKRYYFADRNDYFLRNDKRIEKLKKLGHDEISALLPSDLREEEWLRQNKLKLNREEDVVRYIDHLNALLADKK